MNIEYVRTPSGDKIPLRGIQDVKGGGNQGKMIGAMAITGILFWRLRIVLLSSRKRYHN